MSPLPRLDFVRTARSRNYCYGPHRSAPGGPEEGRGTTCACTHAPCAVYSLDLCSPALTGLPRLFCEKCFERHNRIKRLELGLGLQRGKVLALLPLDIAARLQYQQRGLRKICKVALPTIYPARVMPSKTPRMDFGCARAPPDRSSVRQSKGKRVSLATSSSTHTSK
jgi:hypothetical protein